MPSNIMEQLRAAKATLESESDGGQLESGGDLEAGANLEGDVPLVDDAAAAGASKGDGKGATRGGDKPAVGDVSAERARKPDGKFAKETAATRKAKAAAKEQTGKEQPPKADAAPQLGVEGNAPPGGQVGAPSSQQAAPSRPPPSWKPMAGEKWATLPPEVQAEVHRVDREVKQVMQESAQARQFVSQLQQKWAPIIPALGGADPVAASTEALQFVAQLRSVPPVERAQMLWRLAGAYGVTEDHLVAARDGAPAPQAQPEYRDPRVDALLHHLQSNQAQRQQSEAERAAKEWAEFEANNEYAERLRPTMEKLRQSGLANDWATAYNHATQMDQEVRTVLEQRKAKKQQEANAEDMRRARAASSSVKNEPAAPVGAKQSGSILDQIHAAHARLNGR